MSASRPRFFDTDGKLAVAVTLLMMLASGINGQGQAPSSTRTASAQESTYASE